MGTETGGSYAIPILVYITRSRLDFKIVCCSFSVLKSHVLAIEGIDWLTLDNGAKHKTNLYELVTQKKACIVRRGDIFNIALKCKDRAFDVYKDRVKLTFEFGLNPSSFKGKNC